MTLVDIEDRTTWPEDLTSLVSNATSSLDINVRAFGDLVSEGDLDYYEDALRDALKGRKLRAYHATRLLDHEVEAIRENGLRVLSRELLRSRADQAYEHGHIDAEARRALHDSTQFDQGHELLDLSPRVCLALTQFPFRVPHSLYEQLNNWGGEAQYDTPAWRETADEQVRHLGHPAIVVLNIDASDASVARMAGIGLVHLFVGAHLRLTDIGKYMHYCASIPGSDVEEIWQPGTHHYDQFPGLPGHESSAA
ncbi:hypothetical protein [Streptomyces wedmorensis]|uniref:hypothetical protein n=1 Tax=Streptomyces wedmorensis TaxID=43759 RepID=UPI0037B6FFFE